MEQANAIIAISGQSLHLLCLPMAKASNCLLLRRSARADEGSGLENRQGLSALVGSNPTSSAIYYNFYVATRWGASDSSKEAGLLGGLRNSLDESF